MASATEVKRRLMECLRELHLPTFRERFEDRPSARSRSRSVTSSTSWNWRNRSASRGARTGSSAGCGNRIAVGEEPGSVRPEAAAGKRSRGRCGRCWKEPSWTRERTCWRSAFGESGKRTCCARSPRNWCAREGRCVRPCSLLVQDLLVAKRDLKLSRFLKRLSGFEVLIIDDLGYVQQSREEMEVLFTLLAERYERGSVMLTSNLPFSKWESIFKDPMTTAAAIDRLVHHSVILELNVPSYRVEQAQRGHEATTEPGVGDSTPATEGEMSDKSSDTDQPPPDGGAPNGNCNCRRSPRNSPEFRLGAGPCRRVRSW